MMAIYKVSKMEDYSIEFRKHVAYHDHHVFVGEEESHHRLEEVEL
jgi:hypothetical protein